MSRWLAFPLPLVYAFAAGAVLVALLVGYGAIKLAEVAVDLFGGGA